MHIFIGSMVLIRDFFSAFGNAYNEPAKPETELSVRCMAFMLDVSYRIAPDKRAILETTLPGLLAVKIHNELVEYSPTPAEQIRAELISMANAYGKEPAQETKLGPLPIDSLVEYICTVTNNHETGFKGYVRERVLNLIEAAIPFQELVDQA